MDNPAPTSTERPPAGDGSPDQSGGPRVTREQVKDLGRLRRSLTDRHIGGVAGGLARHLDVDPILVRVPLVVAVFLGGAGLLAYAAAWILVPEEGTADRPLGLDERSRGVALTGAGVLAVLVAVADWVDAYWFPWPVALVALVVLWFVNRRATGPAPRRTRAPRPPAPRTPRLPTTRPRCRTTPAWCRRPTRRTPGCAPATRASAAPSCCGSPWR